MAIRVIKGLRIVECDTLAEANSHSREVGDIVLVIGQKAEDKFGSKFSETVAVPTATQGFVNLGTPVWTGGYFQGLRIWSQIIIGFFPNQLSEVQNVNGVTTTILVSIGTGRLRGFNCEINRGALAQTQILASTSGTADPDHLNFFFCTGNLASTAREIHLYNDHSTTALNGARFEGEIFYTNSLAN